MLPFRRRNYNKNTHTHVFPLDFVKLEFFTLETSFTATKIFKGHSPIEIDIECFVTLLTDSFCATSKSYSFVFVCVTHYIFHTEEDEHFLFLNYTRQCVQICLNNCTQYSLPKDKITFIENSTPVLVVRESHGKNLKNRY